MFVFSYVSSIICLILILANGIKKLKKSKKLSKKRSSTESSEDGDDVSLSSPTTSTKRETRAHSGGGHSVLQYNLSLPKDIQDKKLHLEQILLGNEPSFEADERLVVILQLPSGSVVEHFKINSFGTELTVGIKLHKLMWHPTAIHYAVTNDNESAKKDSNSKRSVIRETTLTQAIQNHNELLGSSILNREQLVTIKLNDRVQREKEKISYSTHSYETSSINKMQLSFAYFELSLYQAVVAQKLDEKIMVEDMKIVGEKNESDDGDNFSAGTIECNDDELGNDDRDLSYSMGGSSSHRNMEIDDADENDDGNGNDGRGGDELKKKWQAELQSMETKYQSQLDNMKQTANKLVEANRRQKEIIVKNSTRREHLRSELELTKGMFNTKVKNNVRHAQKLEKELEKAEETLRMAEEARHNQEMIIERFEELEEQRKNHEYDQDAGVEKGDKKRKRPDPNQLTLVTTTTSSTVVTEEDDEASL